MRFNQKNSSHECGHVSSLTAENDMKWSAIHPDRYNFRPAVNPSNKTL